MKVCVIYHSETGNTRHIAQHIGQALIDCKLVEVSDRADYSRLTRFLMQCKKAQCENTTEIEPQKLDVSGYDLLVFGSPVWVFKPTPAIHSIIDVLKGCGGKRAVAFVTNGGKPGKSDEVFKKWIEARGMRFMGFFSVNQKDIEDDTKNRELITFITSAIPNLS
ncbi:MAG: NAD(P)H-dependent oxidoreductase [Methanoregula sp.]|nr:NAD(P)H-dependent oxidoreductase [Methanoregula sp.]